LFTRRPPPGQIRARPARRLFHRGEKTMERTDSTRRPYAPPRLAVYGSLEELTLTQTESKNKNDATQGNTNLKT
jgi:hypothetical protein